jgi:hypothetical protein
MIARDALREILETRDKAKGELDSKVERMKQRNKRRAR